MSTSKTPPFRPTGPGGALAEPPRGRSLAVRFLIAAVGLILLSGGAAYYVAKDEIHKIVAALGKSHTIKLSATVLPEAHGGPETLLLVGNDERKHTTTEPVLPHSNEMLLVRIDPSKPTISMLSIPRELRVPIHTPDGETVETRINAAFLYGWENGGGTKGGVKLMLRTIHEVLGLKVNHVFITNFRKFRWAVDAMGCVYMTVDKRYYHNDATEPEQYMNINLQPGYQRVCGAHALEFVSNRHESTSLVRDARDQRFLLEAKSQYGSSLFEKRERFEEILGKTVETTIRGEAEVLELLKLLIGSAGKPVRQVHFNVSFISEGSEDAASPQQIHEAVSSFLNGTTKIASHRLVTSHTARRKHRRRRAAPPPVPLTPTSSTTIREAIAMAPKLPFTVEVPHGQITTAYSEPDMVHRYSILGPHHHSYPAYVVVVSEGELGQYYNVEGTTWKNPPLFNSEPSQIPIGRRTYDLYYAGEHLKTIAWHEGGAAYWVENTLTYALSAREMLAIAEQTKPVVGTVAKTIVVPAHAPRREDLNLAPAPKGRVSKTYRDGALLGFAGLAIVALMLFPLALWRARKLRRLRAEVAQMMALEERQRAVLLDRIRRSAVVAVAQPVVAQPVPALVGAVAAASAQAVAPAGSASEPSAAAFEAPASAGEPPSPESEAVPALDTAIPEQLPDVSGAEPGASGLETQAPASEPETSGPPTGGQGTAPDANGRASEPGPAPVEPEAGSAASDPEAPASDPPPWPTSI